VSAPFVRTQRALDVDHFWTTVVLVPLIAMLIGAWLVWLFNAQIAIYEVSQVATLRTADMVTASFAAAALERVRPNQRALLHLDGFADRQDEPLPMQVINIVGRPVEGSIEVRLRILPDDTLALPLQRGLKGTVEVQVGHMSPLQLFLQAMGIRSTALNPFE
jgi:hypothetical protein